jgi:cell division septal protein FtsQ
VREQVIGQKVGNRTGMSGKGRSGSMQQRPVRRERGRSGQTVAGPLRVVLAYLPLILKLAVAITIGVLLFFGYRAAASASFFQLRKVEVQGTAKASVDSVQAIVRRDVATMGVWKADLKEISNHLERLLWVRSAIVSRVLPDGIRVRISERVPRVVVRLAGGRLVWVDDDAVLLGEMRPTDQMPQFFLRGWSEDDSEAARAENLERVKKYLELQRLWDGNGMAERVSEVNLLDTRDIRAQLAGDDSQIEVRLGSQDLGKRLQQALEVLDEQRQTSRGPFISYIDLTIGKRAIVGFVSGAHAVMDRVDNSQAESDAKPAPVKGNAKNREDKSRQKEKRDESKQKRHR